VLQVSVGQLIGRGREFGRLVALLDQAAAGEPVVALVSGDAGIGKTRLIGELAAWAAERAFTVLSGRCAELGDSVPYLPLADALRNATTGPLAAGPLLDALAARPVLGRLLSIDFHTLHVGGFGFGGAAEPAGESLVFIAPAQVNAADIVIDLRSLAEAPVSPFAAALRVAVETVEQAQLALPRGPRIVLCCRSGVRAWRAARALQRQGHVSLALVALGE